MKTIKDLREFLKGIGSETLKIGELSLSLEDDGDINISMEHDLIAWISSAQDGKKVLSELRLAIIDDAFTFRKGREEVKNKKAEPDYKAENGVLKERLKEASLAEGKVIAYENMIMGRELTIGR